MTGRIGVDRMVRDMLAIGRPALVIAEVDGPHVRVVLLGGDPDAAVIDLVAALTPQVVPSEFAMFKYINDLRIQTVEVKKSDAVEAKHRDDDARDTEMCYAEIAEARGLPAHEEGLSMTDHASRKGAATHTRSVFTSSTGEEERYFKMGGGPGLLDSSRAEIRCTPVE